MDILAVASEAFPLIKTGGLADVVGALPAALGQHGATVRTLLPGYPAVLSAMHDRRVAADIDGINLIEGRAAGLDVLAVDIPRLFGRPGNPYMDAHGHDWPDNAQRFAALARAAAGIAHGAIPGWQPDIVHCHDWQAGLTPAYLAYAGRPHPPAVLTIHNLAFQGWFPPQLLSELQLPPHSFTIHGVEYNGGIGFLKAGLYFAAAITTVSPTYAREIQTPEGGMGLDGLLRARADRLHGILNGIDTNIWNPETDPGLPARYTAATLERRRENRRVLQRTLALDTDDQALLAGVISRLTWQKGSDLLPAILPTLLGEGGQLVVLGSGDPSLEAALCDAAARHPGRVGLRLGYDEALAHLIQAGADLLLVPSRFEPCGLTQLCALRYGAVPLAARTGGLADTVDRDVGFTFAPIEIETFRRTVAEAGTAFRDPPGWRRRQQAGMSRDVSWASAARAYATLFGNVLAAA